MQQQSMRFEYDVKVGDRIIFLRELSDGPCEEHPGNLYAHEGEEGEICSVGTCWEGFMVKRDKWYADFGAQIGKDFKLLENNDGN